MDSLEKIDNFDFSLKAKLLTSNLLNLKLNKNYWEETISFFEFTFQTFSLRNFAYKRKKKVVPKDFFLHIKSSELHVCNLALFKMLLNSNVGF